jgi:hypothetical protein
MKIREVQIEDILVSAPALAQNILQLDEEPLLLGRQIAIPSGRLDLVYAYQTSLLLLELKVTAFQQRFVRQVLEYRDDLIIYQQSGRLLKGEVVPYLLCTAVSDTQRKSARDNDVICIEYAPDLVLQFFYKNFPSIASFTEIKPIDIGIWNLHLVHQLLYSLETVSSVNELRQTVGNSPRTLYNKIKFASELRLIEWYPNGDHISLSKLGHEYTQRKDPLSPQRLSEGQSELLRRFVMQNPYESSVVLGIASVVESVFSLSKNTYPVLMAQLLEYFTYHAGKYFDWRTNKAKYSGTKMYSNYAVDLGLLAKSGEYVYLTPEGFRFTIQMQLHKSIKMMDLVGSLTASLGPSSNP